MSSPPKQVADVQEQKERRSSLSQMLGRRTSVEDAFKRYQGYTVNGDGFHKENYMKPVTEKSKPT